jgi:hypothetical protein
MADEAATQEQANEPKSSGWSVVSKPMRETNGQTDPAEFERIKALLHDRNMRDQELRELEAEITSFDIQLEELGKQVKDAKKKR